MNLGDDGYDDIHSRAPSAALIGASLAGSATVARADAKDYEFQLVQKETKKGDGAVVAVRLVDKRTGKPVPDAVIFAKRIDMAPDGMPTMTAPLEQLPSTEPGVYRFKTNLMMEGGWQLSLGAKVQGETGTVENKLVLKARHEPRRVGAHDPRHRSGGGGWRLLGRTTRGAGAGQPLGARSGPPRLGRQDAEARGSMGAGRRAGSHPAQPSSVRCASRRCRAQAR